MSKPYVAPDSYDSPAQKNSLQFSVRTLLEVAATVAILLGVAAVFDSNTKPYDQRIGMWGNPFAVCVAIYFWRFRIAGLFSRSMRVAMYLALVALTLPFIYWTGALVSDWSRIPLSKWLGDPLWVYAVPTVSFLAFDLKIHRRNRRNLLIASCVELLLVFPAWTIICLLWQGYLDWFQMG